MPDSWVERVYPDALRDSRTVSELVAIVLGGPEDDAADDATLVLHCRGTVEVLDRAVSLARSPCAVERCLGANVLGSRRVPSPAFPLERRCELMRMLEREADATVIVSALNALSHFKAVESIGPAARFPSP